MSINNFKNVNLPFLQGIRFNIFPFAPTITKVILRSSDLSTTFREMILEGNLYLGRLLTDLIRNQINPKKMSAI